MTTTISDGVELHYRVERFLYGEAELLDAWRLRDWLKLFTEDARYTVPATDLADPDPVHDLYLLNEDYGRLKERVDSLLGKWAHAENPVSTTRRVVTNVRVRPDGEHLDVRANFVVYRARRGASDTYIGEYRHTLLSLPDGTFRFASRSAVLSHENLCAQGKLSIIL
ncbi:aromatic-ring-hydroxylating dioxygenase subunit beta [Amycolatopsis pithecellobii]|uniref:p-cumate dioxygenase n=1 Tax=Amycolatopsis pithecellobii TaxID=664692 RepID=A0A6N7YRJ5_9PSEU|nr:aromatic-ring-hydroxylating dioxygenase subunit beta [Amycolatopsis pithecellobii]MTD55645.1 p-cumate dioxygenase [Amycolatopsis pithecellobii]